MLVQSEVSPKYLNLAVVRCRITCWELVVIKTNVSETAMAEKYTANGKLTKTLFLITTTTSPLATVPTTMTIIAQYSPMIR